MQRWAFGSPCLRHSRRNVTLSKQIHKELHLFNDLYHLVKKSISITCQIMWLQCILQVQKGGNQNLAGYKKAFGNATNFLWFHSFKKEFT